MAEVYISDVCKTAEAQIGKNCGKTNPYSAELDKAKYYNYPKNGVADSCSIFVDDMVYKNTSPQTANNVRHIMCEPNVDNCGAGCKQAAQYFKDAKRWISKPSDFKKGDKVFFKKSNGVLYHTGLIVEKTATEIKTVEGNTNGGKVAKKTYKLTDSKLAGAGRPRYTADERPKTEEKPVESAPVVTEPVTTPEPAPAPVLVPTPAPAPKPATPAKQTWKYQVICKKGLNVRINAGKQFRKVGAVNYGDKVTILEKKNGFGKLGANRWVSLDPNYMKLVK